MTTEHTQAARPTATGAMAPYLKLAQRQLEANLRMASTWAAAMSAMSGSMLAKPSVNAADEAQTGSRYPTGGTGRIFRLINGAAVETGAERLSSPYWATNGSPTPSWPRYLNEPPTVQPDLFDEAIELLIDDDIKTAS
ncbi:MAG: hypothetical protein ABWZ98_03570 [Nakamurella sp.]